MITYLHVHFMNIAKYDTSFSLFNLLILQVGQVDHAITFRTGNQYMFYSISIKSVNQHSIRIK